ncbi:MAG: hypothetical protein A2Y03_05155 [Omnitrophica WOR_2 bacterium GWF2_38_59]|nr:MAG: hypothetical protein A2Y03_05155 [Omnitrophica WOR_2 bacterium GWF2_38_59]OGX48230.1 MAG: hypothetical protein A2243_10135 [Omnitrophica WOR_2 bacterium RIFOXYA2_FULL_38_17]OGX53307.1 MAG: hypothetical protein A2267_02760 [Omnitrophica WOR_2 bacterium RIFOXYA12_FULL_38_10]OGX59605.1 MAG: hypothetical protein A2447_12165 [Omnitrophica WOR_2 bacterium RIFOXYC2_FULL_38_12]OGX59997.1 MAG: hypothetical protein A2306_04700 [Omnitrophica WOR_2 bacterium RIFOXYB2_FULL_38_16]
MIKLYSIEKERSQRLIARNKNVTVDEQAFNRYVSEFPVIPDRKQIFAAYEFAKQIEYIHPGLSSADYLVHPVRVACLALQIDPPVDVDTIVIALLHNVLEVSVLTFEDMREKFNSRVAGSMKALTVDRSRQYNREYKASYYQKINELFLGGRIVKILDKLDNLFLLCFNSDDEIRRIYLQEIEDYIIPMVDRDLKELSKYMRELVEDCRKIGYMTKKR